MFDIIVIGNDLGALTAASLAAHRGRRTILIEDPPKPQASHFSGYTFDNDVVPWTGFESDGISARFLKLIGIDYEHHGDSAGTLLQLIFDNRRIDLEHDIGARARKIARTFDLDEKKIAKIFSRTVHDGGLVAELFRNQASSQRNELKSHINILCKKILYFLRRFTCNLPVGHSAEHRFIQKTFECEHNLFSRYGSGNRYFAFYPYLISQSFSKRSCLPLGRKETIFSAVRERFLALGGSVVSCSNVLRFKMGRDIDIDIEADGTFSTISGRTVIISTKWRKFPLFLKRNRRFSHFGKKLALQTRSRYPFTLHIGVNENNIPDKMAEQVMLSSETGSSSSHPMNNIYIHTSIPGDRAVAPPGKRASSFTAFLSESPASTSDAKLEAVANDMLKTMKWHFPFFLNDIDFIDVEKSIALSRTCQHMYDGENGMEQYMLSATFPMSGATALPNVFFTGGELLPFSGFEGDMLSAIETAKTAIGELFYV